MHALRAPVAFDGTAFIPGGATVIVDADTIVGVEPYDCAVPVACPVTTYDGTLLPGLFDTHVHLVANGELGSLERAGAMSDDELDATIGRSLREEVAAGVTTVRDLGDVRYRALAARERSEPGLPRVLAAGPPITVPDGHCHFLGGVADGPVAVEAAVAERHDHGVDVVKVMASGGMVTLGSDVFGVQFSPADLHLLVRLAHERGLQVLAHAHSLTGIRHALAAGVDGIEHFSGLTEHGIEVPDEVLGHVAEAGTVLDLTLGFDRAAFASMPAPPPGVQEAMRRTGLDFDSAYAARLAVAARVREHGIRVVSGADAGVGPLKRHGSVVLAVSDLLDAGFSTAEALETATAGAAEACGVTDRTGRLAAGLAADVLVVDGDLRGDLEALGRPVTVLVGGVEARA